MATLPATDSEQARSPLATQPTVTAGWGLFRGGLAVAVMLLLVGALAWMVFGYATDHFVDADAKRVLEREKILNDRNAEDAKLLHDPASWMAKDKGIARVPIDQAIALTIPDLQSNEPHPAYPLKQSPPQPANAPTSPDKGAGAAANSSTNPSASNPTVGQPSPAPVAPAPAATPPTSASNPASVSATPPASNPTPPPAPALAAPSPDNNANNPGSPPIPGTSVQPPASAAAPAPTAAAAAGTKPEPLMNPPSQPTPTGTATPSAGEKTTPTPAPTEPGASPSGTT